MSARPVLALFALALLASTPVAAKDKTKPAPMPEEVACSGVYGPDSSEARVIETFGADNVVTGIVPGPEGSEILATTVYPDDPEQSMQFGWWDEDKREYLSYVELSPSQTAPGGARIGMTVAEIVKLNGAPFTINGFWWDYGGYAFIESGAFAMSSEGCSVSIRFDSTLDAPADTNLDAIAGEVTVPSDEPLLETLGMKVNVLSINYPWPEELPQPDYSE